MTQKELAYVEDAIGHEKNIIKICEDLVKNMEEENLVTFMNSEIEKHNTMEQKLLRLLEVKSNEWWTKNE